MSPALLDSDILTELLKHRHANVVRQAAAYLQNHSQYAFSLFTRYEITRGLRAKNAVTQLARFDAFCHNCLIVPLSESVLDRAADLWGYARKGGHACNDADLLIAATSLEFGRVLVTGNSKHFTWVPGLFLSDWRQP